MLKQLTSHDFDEEVINADGKVLVDFWAPWCGPCKAQTPILEKVSAEIGAGVKICKVNVDDEQDIASRYGVMSIPTLIVFENGKPAGKAVGLHSEADVKNLLNA